MAASEVAAQIDALADEHAEVADAAGAWLLDRPELSRPPLVALVDAARADQRTRRAIRLLGRLGNPADVALLADLLDRPGSGLAWEAAQALVLHPSELAAAALRRSTQSVEPETVEAATSALGERGDHGSRSTLEGLLDHRSEAVRYRAVYALGRIGAEASTTALRSASRREPSPDVRTLIDEVLRAPD